MIDREQYTPGPASGARIEKDRVQRGGENGTLLLVRELRHSPEKVWQSITAPAHLREWAPFVTDGNLGTVGTVKLTWVGTPTPLETKVTRADAPKVLEYGDIRWELEAFGGGAPDAVAQHRSTLHLVGRRGLAHLFRCSRSPSERNSHRPNGRRGGDEVRKLAEIKRGVRKA